MNTLEYWNSLNDQDKALLETMSEYEAKYFEDMTLKKLCDINNDVFDSLEFSIGVNLDDTFKAHISNLEDCAGVYSPDTNTITISSEYKTDKTIILHEMTHYYVFKLEQLWSCYAEWLLLRLYNKLSTEISDLDSRVMAHIERLHYDAEQNTHGAHGILFFLKSYELDIGCGYELGTVCGYERESFNT